MNSKEKTQIIKKSPLFNNLEESQVESIAEIARLKEFSEGEILISQGDKEAGVYNVLDAWLKSPSHKDIVLSEKYAEIGIGSCGSYVTVHFGRQIKTTPQRLTFLLKSIL